MEPSGAQGGENEEAELAGLRAENERHRRV